MFFSRLRQQLRPMEEYIMEYELNDTASNPLDDGHLPVSGEIDPKVNDEEELNPDIADDMPGR